MDSTKNVNVGNGTVPVNNKPLVPNQLRHLIPLVRTKDENRKTRSDGMKVAECLQIVVPRMREQIDEALRCVNAPIRFGVQYTKSEFPQDLRNWIENGKLTMAEILSDLNFLYTADEGYTVTFPDSNTIIINVDVSDDGRPGLF